MSWNIYRNYYQKIYFITVNRTFKPESHIEYQVIKEGGIYRVYKSNGYDNQLLTSAVLLNEAKAYVEKLIEA